MRTLRDLGYESHRFQCDKSNLRSALDLQERAIVEANETILHLESALNTAQADAERLTADHNTAVTYLEHENANLQSALATRGRAVIGANKTISNLRSALSAAQEDTQTVRVRKLLILQYDSNLQ